MPYKLRLSWHEARKCWKKYYKGKHYYLAKRECRGKSDMQGYRLALEEWDNLKRIIDNTSNHQSQNYRDIDSHSDHTISTAFATSWDKLRTRPRASLPEAIHEIQLSKVIQLFINDDKERARTDQISVKEFKNREGVMNDFLAFARGEDHSIISPEDVELLLNYQRGLIYLTKPKKDDAAHKLSPHTVKTRLKHVKRLYTWACRQDIIPKIPRCLDATYTRITIPSPKPKFFTVDEIRLLFANATPRTKLYIALGLNCGYRQIDISTLEDDMIDWDHGIIDRLRHKTKRKGIRQKHKLWKITRELLWQERSKKPGYVLLGKNGHPLSRDVMAEEDDRYKHIDVIGLAFSRLTKRLKFPPGKTFKHFRCTGANDILQQYQRSPELTDLYLAHVTKGLRGHYAEPYYELLFEAIDYLEKRYQLK